MRYEAPQTVEEAARLLHGAPAPARVLAGGTDLIVQMRSGVAEPALVVDIKRIAGTREIVAEDGGFRIGAAVPCAAMGEHAALCAAWPGIVEAANLIGSTQVQGRATIAGNLCNGSPAADSVPGLVAAGATARIAGPGGVRDCPVVDILAGPGRTTLAPDEFVVSLFLPARPPHAADAYLRFIPRTEMDIAVASAAVNVTLAGDGSVAKAQVALGAVAPTVRLVEAAGEALVGSRMDDGALDAMTVACRAACSPIDDKRGTVEFRIHVAGVLARRAALIAFNRAGGRT